MPRIIKLFIPLLFILINLSCKSTIIPLSTNHYLFAYFTKNGQDGLHLAASKDGIKWSALKNGQSLLKPQVGEDKLMRDPCIIQGPDGKFHLIWTISWNSRGIGYTNSNDLVHWSVQQYIPVMEHEPDARNCWAPELFYDAKHEEYVIFWSSTIPGRFPETDNQSNDGPPAPGNNHRMYYVTTKDFTIFSETKMFYDQGFNVIDGTLVQDKERYLLFLKDETNKPFTPQKNIRYAIGSRAAGPFGPPSVPITGDYWAEGPSVIKIGNKWYLYFDKYMDHQYGLLVSGNLKNWQDYSDKLVMPEGIRHGTVFSVTGKEYNVLIENLKNLD